MFTRAPASTLLLRPLACGSLAAVLTRAGAVLAVLPPADALALAQSLTRCIRPAAGARTALPRTTDAAA